ncbi:MAG TPA: hypothetical protein VL128_13975 [Candidatus Eisenbacteria bacterium]|nr:hypothetical protein [Candidatus Eisenbacteria bacterium]
MKRARPIRGKRAGQEGYALVLAVFLLALVVVSLATVTPNILINGRREKEEEMIWRGKQYVRGIRLYVRYYQMHGGQTRFPTSMDDLVKNNVGIRFMRQAYKDPMNMKDGSWRFIYVGPNGQLIGSLKEHALGSVSAGVGGTSAGGFGSLFGGSGQGAGNSGAQNSSFGSSGFGGSSFGNSSSGNSSFGNSSFGNSTANTGMTPGQAGTNSNAAAPADAPSGDNPQGTDAMSTPQAIQTADVTSDIVGGNIIGVGSKVNQKSVIWYDKAKNYRQFEFIWDPSKEPINGGTNSGVVGVPPQVPQNGSNSIFSSPGGASTFGQGNNGTNANPGQNGTPDQPPPGQQSPNPQ